MNAEHGATIDLRAAISAWSAGRSATSSGPTGATARRGIFTFVFPIMFLVIFASIYQGSTIATRAGSPTTTSSSRGSSPTA